MALGDELLQFFHAGSKNATGAQLLMLFGKSPGSMRKTRPCVSPK